MIPKLSIIVPTYNSAARVRESLTAIRLVAVAQQADIEVIIVDDGSSDDTRAVVAPFLDQLPSPSYLFRPRDGDSCRARARNLGIRNAKGRRLLFLDAGVVPSASLIADALRPDPLERAMIYKTLGLFAPESYRGYQPSAAWVLEMAPRLARAREWRDVREPFMPTAGSDSIELPSPWLLAWTCAFSVPRGEAVAVGGFDEAYMGWGLEDVDFAARLAAAGVAFGWNATALALHLPHAPAAGWQQDHHRNALRMHAKLCNRESELFTLWHDAFMVNLFVARLNALRLDQVVPPCRFDVADLPGPAGASTLLAGLRWGDVPAGLEAAAILAHEPRLAGLLAARWPQAEVRCLTGVRLPHSDFEFERAVVGDVLRLMPNDVVKATLSELRRVAREVQLVLCVRDGRAHLNREVAGWSFLPVAALRELAQGAGLAFIAERPLDDGTLLLQFRSSAAPEQAASGLARVSGGSAAECTR